MPYHNTWEYLTIKNAALISCVSDERFIRWVDKGLIPVITKGENTFVRSRDLVQHLIQYNIPIPDGLLQGSAKKILFIFLQRIMPKGFSAEIIQVLYKLRSQTSFILDFIEDDSCTSLKIMTFKPDIIFLLFGQCNVSLTTNSIKETLMKDVPVYSFHADRNIDFTTFISNCVQRQI